MRLNPARLEEIALDHRERRRRRLTQGGGQIAVDFKCDHLFRAYHERRSQRAASRTDLVEHFVGLRTDRADHFFHPGGLEEVLPETLANDHHDANDVVRNVQPLSLAPSHALHLRTYSRACQYRSSISSISSSLNPK